MGTNQGNVKGESGVLAIFNRYVWRRITAPPDLFFVMPGKQPVLSFSPGLKIMQALRLCSKQSSNDKLHTCQIWWYNNSPPHVTIKMGIAQ